ncbi:GTP pyrophosphokinase [Enemella evansiae]|uniref:GTP pyrophosphokinase n=1 Tax=Enemella evansiae TaxID=2016499 RepID=A0A255GN22_9ACTN|nr:GTP pyrophosphokinase family protein [Enemella evansiae]PFG68647.1 putative GTP pyrophosphokinase [Propionibacteriaceae bacterium ES.041]OYN94063.1 GTP pyrophosphokinase [Enemella evansiae]OYN95348.1 GTP pyrophosphokinase [Enemella evansiae]OYO03451.1 GTP pyrophosphokinase [Enemella evansiae]OYO09310.1 GTP pyrophosphokinase [Enemella evansiae]
MPEPLLDPALLEEFPISRLLAERDRLGRFLLGYQSGIEEVSTKLRILEQEFQHMHEYNPIEHVASRLKKPESVLAKAQRIGCPPQLEAMREQITDIAGVRVVCSFVRDVYEVVEMLVQQPDVTVLKRKDYIAEPKENGYRSLHVIVEVPVFFSREQLQVPVEVQFRTIAMDFWASLEHKIYYKYDREVPGELLEGLHDAAETAARLDADMERLHVQVHGAFPETRYEF